MHQILVGGDHADESVVWNRANERRNHIIRFKILHLQEWNAKGLKKICQERNLTREIFGLGIPIRFIPLEDPIPEASTAWVEGNRRPGGRLLAQDLRQHIGKAQQCVGGRAIGCPQTRGKCEKCTINCIRTVDDDESALAFILGFSAHGAMVPIPEMSA